MGKKFFIILLLLLIALVIQVKWGSSFILSGAPLVLGSLVLAGTFLEWDGVLCLSLLAVWALKTERGVHAEMVILFAISFVALEVKRLTAPKFSKTFFRIRKDVATPVLAVCAVLALLSVSALSVSSLPSLDAFFGTIFVATLWSLFGVYLFAFLE